MLFSGFHEHLFFRPDCRCLAVGLFLLLTGLMLVPPVGAAGCSSAPAGLVSWWPGDGNANDIAGTNNGALQGGATATNVGVVATAFSFDGTNGTVRIADSPSLRPTNLTVEAWVRFSSLNSAGTAPAGSQYIVFKQNSRSASFEGFELGKVRSGSSDTFTFVVTSSAGLSAFVNSSTLVNTGVWYHVAGVRGTNFLQIYVNGQMQSQTNVSFAQNYGTLPLYFGTSGQSSFDRKFAGTLDEVSLYNRALTSNEVSAIYAAGAAGKCKDVSITLQPQSQTVPPGSNVTFTVAATGFGLLRYQWLFNGGSINGATNTSLTLTNVQPANAGGYSVTVSNSLGSLTSATAVLAVIAQPTITTPPQSQAVNAGNNVTFNVVATGTGPLSYQWQFNSSAILLATNASLTLTNVQPANVGNYTVVVSNVMGSVTSTPPAVLTVNLLPTITTPPQSQAVNAGNNVTFNVVASGAGPLSYQWQFNSSAILLATNASLTLTNVQPANAGNYTVVVSNVAGSVTSMPPAVLTVNLPPTITTPPQSQTVNAGTNVTFNVVATGTGLLGYQWQFNGASIGGANGTSLTLTNVQPANGGSYTVVVSDQAGSVTSAPPAVLTVNVPPVITTQPQGQTVIAGNNVSFNVVATGTAPLSYQWRFNGGVIAGATNSSLTLTNVQPASAGIYAVVVSNVSGNVTSTPPAVLIVNVPPTITGPPQSQTVATGDNVSFNVAATGTGLLSYQWRFNGTAIAGATGASLSLTDVQPASAGNYAVVVSDQAGSVTSTPPAVLTVSTANVVNFPDPNLEAAVRATLARPGGLLTQADLQLLNSLSGTYRGITNLSGLEWAVNLKGLYLTGNAVRDLAPLQGAHGLVALELDHNLISDLSPLSALTNLSSLVLGDNDIFDYSPVSGLTNLARLSLNQGSITNLEFLQNLSALNSLMLNGNHFDSISPLTVLTNLTCLDLRWNAVTDLNLLSGFTNLTRLYLGGGFATDLSFLQPLTGLIFLDAENDGVADLSALAGLTNLNHLILSDNPGITNYEVLEGLNNLFNIELRANSISNLTFISSLGRLIYADLARNDIVDVSPLVGLTNLASVNLSGNPTSSFIPGLGEQTNLWLFHHSISNVTFLAGMTQLTVLGLNDNLINDPSPLMALTNLQYLGLSKNPVTNYGVLSGFTNLTRLWLEGNTSSNLGFIQGMTSLRDLSLRDNRFTNLTALTGLTNLNSVYVGKNRLTDISALTNLPQLARVEISGNLLDLRAGSPASAIVQSLQSRGIEVDYLPTNQPPVIFVPSVWYIPANQTSSLSFYVSDALVSSGEITLAAGSSNPSLVPVSSMAFGNDSGSNRTFTITPAANQTGAAVITLTASQPPGGLSVSANVLVTVLFPSNVAMQSSLASDVSATLNLSGGKINSVQMLGLTNLFAYDSGISDLSGLQWASNLTLLYLDNNSIASVAPLKNLTGLTTLSLYNNNIADVTPLAGLTNLTYLDLSWNPVTNLPVLSGLSRLTSLFLAGDSATNVGFLTNFPYLVALDLSYNGLGDVSPLSGLTNLLALYLQQNRLINVDPLDTALAPFTFVDLSLNLLPYSAIDTLLLNDVYVNFSPQRTAPFVDVRTNWLVSPNSSAVLSFNVWDTGPPGEALAVGVSSSNTDVGLSLIPPPGQVANGTWTLVVTNQISSNALRSINVSATNDVGYTATARIAVQIAPTVPVTGQWFGNTNLSWSSGGDVPWFGQGIISDGSFLAAQSGAIANNESTSLQLNVVGPGRLSFWWKVSSEAFSDWLQFSVADYTNSVSGNVDWQSQVANVPPGPQTPIWTYYKDGGGSARYDAAWLAQITYLPGIWLELVGRVTNRQCNLLLHAVPGSAYQVQVSTNLINWSSLAVITPTNTDMPFLDTNAVPGTRFYRLYTLPSSSILLDSPGLTNGTFRFVVHSLTNQHLSILASTALTNSSWTTLTSFTNTLGAVPYTDVQSTGFSRRFYRVLLLP
jgi:Leucine-rich repeat (LRR) protein